MNILALIGSYRKQGNTARIVELIAARMQALAAQDATPLEFETLFLSDLDLLPCRGCRACFDRGEAACPLHDDVPRLRAKMGAADALLLASPVYVDDVSGLIKIWMDRLAYLCHRPALAGKAAYLLATVGGSATSHALRTMSAGVLTWGYHLVGQTGLKMGALATAEDLPRYQPAAERVAQRLLLRHGAATGAAPLPLLPVGFPGAAISLAARIAGIRGLCLLGGAGLVSAPLHLLHSAPG